jgi:hypothetical protein
MTRSLTTLALVLGLLVSLPACEGASGLLADDDDPTEPTEAPTEAERTAQRLYDPDHVVEIELTIAPEDAAALASETNDLFSLLEGEDCLDTQRNASGAGTDPAAPRETLNHATPICSSSDNLLYVTYPPRSDRWPPSRRSPWSTACPCRRRSS